MGEKFEPWVITPGVTSPSEYVRWSLFNNEIFHLWDFPAYLCIIMYKEQLVSLWRDL